MNLPGGIWSTRDASDLVSDTEDVAFVKLVQLVGG